VQKIHYKVCKFEKETINESLNEGDCRHKAELLKKLLEKEGFEVKNKMWFLIGQICLFQKMLEVY